MNRALLMAVTMLLAACGGGGDGYGGGSGSGSGGGYGGGMTYTVGGTVSGLTGTVVLQDNGGDNLPISANGPFTFATALAFGAPYAVTVLTQPMGQMCTVANGNGTYTGSPSYNSVMVTCL